MSSPASLPGPHAGWALRSLRLRAGLTLNDVATRSGRSVSRLSRIETGQLTAPDDYLASVLRVIADALASDPPAAPPAAGPPERGRPASPVVPPALAFPQE